MTKKKKILYIQRDDGGCGFFRCRQPADHIKRMGLADTEVVMLNPTKEQLVNADLVIMQEMGSVNASNMRKFMIDNKIPYMTEFDDFVQHVSPKNHGGYGAWNPATLFTHRAMEATREAIGVTVSTNQLAREYFPYNPTIYVIPNYLDKEKWSNPVVKRNDGKIRIGWCGGNAHADDLKMVAGAVDKLVKESGGKIIFETMGMTRQELAGVFPMKIHNDSCPSCGYEGELHHFPGESLDDYPLVLAARGWDIAIAPVINNSFNNCKSDLKIKEYSAVGVPIVASPVVPYKEAAADGASVVFADSFDEWYNALRDLVDNPEKRDVISRQNKEWIEKYWIQDNAQHIFEAYNQVIARAESTLGIKEDRLKKIGLL